jgi:phage/plasmid-like protein (TIGR03299 family)
MSHDLSIRADGTVEMFVAGAPAWHNLGQNVEKAVRWEEAVKLAHLDWNVSKLQLHNPRTNDLIPSFALVRDDTGKWINTVGGDYLPIQNVQCFDFVDALVESKQAHYVSAGALQGGKIVWCLAGVDQADFEPLPGDKYKTYLLFTDYRGQKQATCKISTVRVVCNNTLQMALSGGGDTMRFRHTSKVAEKLDEAKKLTLGVQGDVKKLAEKMKQLAEIKLDKKSFETIIASLFPSAVSTEKPSARALNQAAAVAQTFQHNDGSKAVKGTAGTAYAMLQAVTNWVDHQKDGFKGGDMNTRRAEDAMFGRGDALKRDAFDIICRACGVSLMFSENLKLAAAVTADVSSN